MRILLDTHVLIWALSEPQRLAKAARVAIEDPKNEILFSAASIWEIAIKAQIGRVNFSVSPQQIAQAGLESGFLEYPVDYKAAALVAQLPMHHRDPFDRLLIAQAISEPAKLFTVDIALKPYSELVMVI